MCNYGDSIYTSSVTQDAFFAKTNNNGGVEWFNHFGGVNPTVDRICINDFGQLTICGEFYSQMQLGSSILNCQGNQDVFVAKCFYNLTQEKLCRVSGHAFIDINNSCSYDLGIDINLKNAIVSAIPGPTYAITNNSGYYELNLNPGSYVVSEISPDSSLFEPTCQTSFNLNLINRFDSIGEIGRASCRERV